MNTVILRAKFAIQADYENEYEGFEKVGEHWNGWAIPYFEKEAAEKFIARQVDGGYCKAKFNYNLDQFELLFTDVDDNEVEIYEGQTIEFEGEKIKVYSIGGGCYVWDRMDEEED